MSRPTARVLALLELLQAGGVRTANELAERLAVDERTVRRYVDHLIELGVPVETVRGRYGGYRIAAGSHLPPLMLTDEEALSVVLGLTAIARTGPSAATRTAAETAAAKMGRVLPTRIADRLRGLRDVRTTARAATGDAAATDAILTATTAVDERRPLRIRHRRGDASTDRTVLPWGVVEHEGRWYLVGLDSASDAVRTFRMDRIERIETGPGHFTPPPDADPMAEVLASLARMPRAHTVRVRIRATEEAIRRRLPASVAALAPAEDEGWVLMTIEAARLDWVAGALAQLDAPFHIEQPDALRAEVRALADRLAARA